MRWRWSVRSDIADGLIALLRLINKTDISRAVWQTRRLSKPLLYITVPWCALITATLLSPVEFPVVDASTLNWAPVVLAAVTVIVRCLAIGSI